MTLDEATLLPAASPMSWWALGAVSALTALLMLLAFRFASDQRGIGIAKDRIKAHLLEIRLFRDEPWLVLRAQKHIIGAILRYLRLAMAPIAVLILPVVYLALHLELFFGYQPLHAGESAMVSVTLDDRVAWDKLEVDLAVPDGVLVETPPLRIARAREVDWRVRVLREGIHDIVVTVGETAYPKMMTVADGLHRVIPSRERGSRLMALFVPGETPLPSNAPVTVISVQYAPRSFELFGWQLHWLIPFMAIAFVVGFALQGVFGVRL